MQRKTRLMALVLVVALASLSSSALAKVTEVSFWSPFTGPDGEVIEQMVKDFNEGEGQEKGVKIDLLIVPWEDYYTKLTVAVASGRGPNLAICHSHRVAGFAGEGALLEFKPATLESSGITQEDYISALWQAGEVNGHRYAVPIDAFPRNLYYNKTLFRNVGLDENQPLDTLEDIILAGQKITNPEAGVWGYCFGVRGSWVQRDFYAYYWQMAPSMFSADYKGVAPEFAETAKRVFQTNLDLIHKYKIAPAEPVAYGPLMAQNKLGIAVSQITELGMLEKSPGLDFGAAPTPLFGEEKATYALGHNFVMPRGRDQTAQKMQAANSFIDWFARHGLEWARGGKVPASYAVLNDPRFAEMEIQSVVASQLDYMRIPPAIPQIPAIDQVIVDNGEAIYAGKASIDEAVDRMIEQIEKILAR